MRHFSPGAMIKPFRRAYIEITNICNLSCNFCPKTTRALSIMSPEKFRTLAIQVKPLAEIVFLHVLGEPFMHPDLPDILKICSETGLKVNLVTNGVLFEKYGPGIFTEGCLKQLSISLQALESFSESERSRLLAKYAGFAAVMPEDLILSFRLRGNIRSEFVSAVSGRLFSLFNTSAAVLKSKKSRPGLFSPVKLASKVYLNSGEFFEWPGGKAGTGKNTCLGLEHHFAVLVGGEVTACCADYDGKLVFGDSNRQSLSEILTGRDFLQLRESLSGYGRMPAYCRSCGFTGP